MKKFKSLSARKSITSNAAKDVVADSLIPVKLPRELESEYNNVFFPKNRPSKTNKLTIKLYHTLISYMGSLGDSFERYFDLHRQVLSNGAMLDTSPPEEIDNWIANASEVATNARSGAVKALMNSYYSSLTSGKSHVIQPSTKYNGGFDVVFLGDPDSEKSTLMVAKKDHHIKGNIDLTSQMQKDIYENENLTKYSTKLSLKVVDSASTILSTLFEEKGTSVDSGDRRIMAKLPLDFDFTSLDRVFGLKTGLKINGQFITDNVDQNVIAMLKDYVSILVIRNPQKEVVRSSINNIHRTQNNPDAPVVSEVKPTKEGVVCYPNLSFSLVMHIPEQIARFITQTPEGSKIPLSVLNNWVRIWSAAILRQPGSRASGAALLGGRRITKNKLPRYILPGSQIAKIIDVRKENKYYVEEGRTNEDNLYVSSNGTLKFCPKAGVVNNDNINAYEADMEKVIEEHFSRGIPIDFSRKTVSRYYNIESNDANLDSKLKEHRDSIEKHSGKLLAYTWDYDVQLNVKENDPSQMQPVSLVGATKPDSMVIADYLGFNYSDDEDKPERKSFKESMLLLFSEGAEVNDPDDAVTSYLSSFDPGALMSAPSMEMLCKFYGALSVMGKVPTFQDLLQTVRQQRENSVSFAEDPVEANLYSNYFSNEYAVRTVETVPGERTAEMLQQVMAIVIRNATGTGQSTLRTAFIKEDGLEGKALEDAVKDSNYYFDFDGPMSGFGNLYNYVGGAIFKAAVSTLTSMDTNELITFDYKPDSSQKYNADFSLSFAQLSGVVMPLALMFSKYIPEADKYFEEAEELKKGLEPDDNIDEDSIAIPGLKPGTQVFPHQLKSHKRLRNRPRSSILDISPGGGKTILGITDAAACVKEMQELGQKIKPLMLAPDGLVKNWCDDLVKFLGSNWNVIPLTTKIYRRWGEEKLFDLLSKAPPNTIVVAGINFLKSQTFPVVLGASVTMVSGPVEFIKRLGYNYILMDESHKIKNVKSIIHNTVKQLTTMSIVKYIRLATGTLISNKLTDIVGQTAAISSHVFRSPEHYEAEYSIVEGGKVVAWLPDTATRARNKLNHYASVITMKRKEWAFMLPNPIESFFSVALNDDDNPNSELHLQVYNAVLEETLEKLQEAMNQRGSAGGPDDDDDDDKKPTIVGRVGADDDDDDAEDLDLDEDTDKLAGLESLLRPYLQRLEQILTDPLGDPLGREIFKRAGVDSYMSRKVKKVIDLIDAHYNIRKWDDQTTFKELELVSFNDNNYLLRKQNTENPTRETVVNNGRNPEDDTDTWKLEPRGKIIIFCRYVRSVEAIFNNLPEKYKAVARKFSGNEGKVKWENLQAFKSDDSVQILIAVEMAITEGHNLQMASRMIRVEEPWAPGDLDQSSSRIFRPDPAAAKSMAGTGKPGELYREVIFLDWVMANGTMEVAKFGRLIHKIIAKSQFDEAGNEMYDSVKDVALDIIPMDLETIASQTLLSDISEYTDTYSQIRNIQMQEFTAMRRKEDVRMYDLTPAPNVEGAAMIDNVPLVDDQEIADPNNYGLVKGREFLLDPSNQAYKEEPKALIGLPVKTEFGTGQIVNVRIKTTKLDDGSRELDKENPIQSLSVRLNGDDSLYTFKMTQVYIATNLNETNKNAFTTDKPWASETERKNTIKQMEREAAKNRKEEEAEERKRLREEAAELRRAEKQGRAKKRAKQRAENKRKGLPLNSNIKEVKAIKTKTLGKGEVVVDSNADMMVNLEPTVYNGFIAAMVDAKDDDAKNLKGLGFKDFGPYAYIRVRNFNKLWAVYDYVQKHFELSPATERRLDIAQDSFEESKGKRFSADIAPIGDLQNFFRTRHKKTTNRKEVKIYPIVEEDALVLAVDITTNPAIVKHINKSVPGSATKWRKSVGAAVYFAKNKTEAKRVVTKLKKAGYFVTNKEEYLDAIRTLKVRRS